MLNNNDIKFLSTLDTYVHRDIELNRIGKSLEAASEQLAKLIAQMNDNPQADVRSTFENKHN